MVMFHSPLNPRFLSALALALAASVALQAGHEDKKKEEKRSEPPRREAPAPRAEPRQERREQPRPEVRREPPAPARIEPPRPETRRDLPPPARTEPRTEAPRPETRRDLPPPVRTEPRTETPRPEIRRDLPPPARTEPAPGRVSPAVPPARPETRRDMPPPTPGQPRTEPGRPSGQVRPEPQQRPGPQGGREILRPVGPDRRFPERQIVRAPGGGEIHRTPGGLIREVHTPNGAIIRHNPSGVRQVEVVRPGGRVIVANGSGRVGFVQRPVVIHNTTIVQRTYIINGRPQARVYRPWAYGGREYCVYMPHHYYRPTFYTWAYTPWSRPVVYHWGWARRPWYGYYGGYFRPYPRYAGPSFWLADFIISSTLEAAFMAQNVTVTTAPVEYDDRTAMSPEVKQAIADEVRRQLDQEREDEARGGMATGVPPLFTANGPKVFLVSGNVMGYANGQECPLVDGDVLGLVRTPAPGDEWAEVKILSCRGSNCPRGAVVAVRTQDLQEMQNHLQATLDQGMEQLQSNQGSSGLPAMPASAAGTVNASYTSVIHPDDNALDELDEAIKEANGAEQAMIKEGGREDASGSGSGGSSTTTISMGMTPAQVEAALGAPKNIVDLGKKKIYVYKDLKVTFLNGRVSDVQ